MAGNTGLLPRHVRIPSWVHEGLATYFETPNGAMWSGIGAVNESRLSLYRALERDREHSNIGFIVGDQIFDYAGSLGAKLHGYGQAWALTHFLMEKHFDKFIALLSPPRRAAARHRSSARRSSTSSSTNASTSTAPSSTSNGAATWPRSRRTSS